MQRMRAANLGLPIEVEAQSLEQVDAALAPAPTSCCSTTSRRRTSSRRSASAAAARETEISGGVTLARMPELAATGADYVSIGALTHSAPAADLSFEIEMGS